MCDNEIIDSTEGFITDFKELSELCADDKRFCVMCMRSRTDVPVTDNCCYNCGGGERIMLQ